MVSCESLWIGQLTPFLELPLQAREDLVWLPSLWSHTGPESCAAVYQWGDISSSSVLSVSGPWMQEQPLMALTRLTFTHRCQDHRITVPGIAGLCSGWRGPCPAPPLLCWALSSLLQGPPALGPLLLESDSLAAVIFHRVCLPPLAYPQWSCPHVFGLALLGYVKSQAECPVSLPQ